MGGKYNQYDPSELFLEWIQKSGKNQREFMQIFSEMLSAEPKKKFDPLSALKEMMNNAEESQTNLMNNLAAMQNQAMNNMFSFGQNMGDLLSYSSFKTTIGSNGRISIPEAERSALNLEERDLVQVMILPIKKANKKN